MKRTGTIYTFTVVHSAAEAFKERTPYVVALVDENGHRVVSLLEGYDPTRQVEIGQEVAYVSDDAAGNRIYKLI